MEINKKSMFTTIEENVGWSIVYNNKTKVMYAVSTGFYNNGYFTVLVNADGSPMLWMG